MACDPATTIRISDRLCCNWKFRSDGKMKPVLTLLKFLYFLILLTRWQNASLLFSVWRVHLAKQNDPVCHSRPIGRRLSMAGLGCHHQSTQLNGQLTKMSSNTKSNTRQTPSKAMSLSTYKYWKCFVWTIPAWLLSITTCNYVHMKNCLNYETEKYSLSYMALIAISLWAGQSKPAALRPSSLWTAARFWTHGLNNYCVLRGTHLNQVIHRWERKVLPNRCTCILIYLLINYFVWKSIHLFIYLYIWGMRQRQICVQPFYLTCFVPLKKLKASVQLL
mgnify:FL=1